MTPVIRTRDASMLPLPKGYTRQLVKLHKAGAIGGAVLYPDGDSWAALAWGRDCAEDTVDGATQAAPRPVSWVWDPSLPKAPTPNATRAGSRTAAAVALLQSGGAPTPHAAAVAAGVSPAAVYRALRRARRPACPCCGRPS